MNLKKIAVVAGAMMASNAYALVPGTPTDVNPIYMSGASAQDGNIEALFTDLCVAGSLDIFRDIANPAKPGKGYRVFFCNVDSTKVTFPAGTPNNPAVRFHKRSAGGSAQGVNPLIDGTAIEAMSIDNGNCTNVGAGEWECTVGNAGDLISVNSTAGISDVDPGMFRGVNTPGGSAPADPASVASTLDVFPAAALVFGVPVTTPLRDALQEVELRLGLIPAGCTVGDETEACMPTLSKRQVASFISGQVQNWDQVTAPDTNGNLVSMIQAVAPALRPSNNQMSICRRVNGSGTQAQMNAKFLHTPCTSSALEPAASGNPFLGPTIVLNSGSGDVDLCLDDFGSGTNASGQNLGNTVRWALGVQSTEKNANRALNYRFVKIDGVSPTVENAAAGLYMDWVEQSYQWPKSGFPGAPDSEQLAVLTAIQQNAGNPTVLANLNATKYTHSWGIGGYLALAADHNLSAGGIWDDANPVMPYTHGPAGSALDNCRVPVYDNRATDGVNTPIFPH